jgi:hypothetical protein
MYNVTNANVQNKCLNVHYVACIFAWYMFEWPYTIYGERWPIRIFYIFILFYFIFLPVLASPNHAHALKLELIDGERNPRLLFVWLHFMSICEPKLSSDNLCLDTFKPFKHGPAHHHRIPELGARALHVLNDIWLSIECQLLSNRRYEILIIP